MLDKSVPYKNVIMEIEAEKILAIPEAHLPEGFSFSFYEEGMETDWARIETSVLEFDSEADAYNYFVKDYVPFKDELKKRCVFIKNPEGLPVATATAWFSKSELGYQASLHWVAVDPEYQGLGLGRAIMQKATKLFAVTDQGVDVILHTQTWSHKAILLYLEMGYYFSKTKKLACMEDGGEAVKILGNDCDEAIEVLKTIVDMSVVEKIISEAK